MNNRACIRCHQPVQLEDGHLVFCTHCGAPQIFLSEELQAQIAESTLEYDQRNTAAAAPSPDAPPPPRWGRRGNGRAARQSWPVAVEYALLSAAVTLALGLLSILLPPTGALMLLWVLGAPILTVTLFNTRARTATATDSGFAARLGLLTAVLVMLCCAVVFTLSLALKRFVFHDAGLFDAQLAATFAQQRQIALERFGASVQPTLDMLSVPEFRVGLMLSGAGLFTAFYLSISTLAAGVTGIVLRRRPTA